jgi:hypothetical protein
MGAESLAERIQQPVIVAKDLLRKHREASRTFWQWSDGNVDYALLHKSLWTVFGWQIQVAGQNQTRWEQESLDGISEKNLHRL